MQDNGEMQQAIQEVMTTLSLDVQDDAAASASPGKPLAGAAGAAETSIAARGPSCAHKGGASGPAPAKAVGMLHSMHSLGTHSTRLASWSMPGRAVGHAERRPRV